MSMDYRVWPSPHSLAVAAAELVAAAIRTAVAARGRCRLALAGGSTPVLLLRELSRPSYQQLPWQSVSLFWSDERFVAPDHPDSNFRMVRENLLAALAVKPEIYPISTAFDSPATAARAYETVIDSAFAAADREDNWPVFDCILLGVGTDGHTASLFPGDEALAEIRRWTAAGRAPDGSPRVTLTLPLLNAARQVLFLASGSGKAAIIAALAGGADLPAARVKAAKVLWLLDAAAAAHLPV
ncbi:MAG: 6-phosphogluconolactonase [Sporomusaceae bacterium]|nr:6-phosphogluconolactonase [Sporomusaceae bacterium]